MEQLVKKLGPFPYSSKPFWEKINRLRTNNVNSQIPTLNIDDKEFKTDKEKEDLFRAILCKTFFLITANFIFKLLKKDYN
ncbi:hypothetical protein BpHYR1_004146 [Brachionus plicatilis]|uniref:Uncharacterized protein n=1 Tax=Brachionus plicatilis TaxID=10195 RepID=A0A3M7R117_BRAPC|nr:hypothetical protein BpHYR1_004146 [Brachionus plicatilis]